MSDGMERTTLVTGASGFLGAHVVAAACARSQREGTFSDPLGPLVVAQTRSPALLAPRFTTPRDAAQWIETELLDGGAERLLDRVRPTEVIHCAALSRAAACEEDSELAQALNGVLPGLIAAWCQAHGARLIHVSTDLVFGAEDAPKGGFKETATPAPVSTYGVTKLAGERAALSAYPDTTIARLPLLYGNSGGRGLGASDSILEQVERSESPRLFVDEWRTPLEVTNAAAALIELLDFDHPGPIHLAGTTRTSRYDFGIAVLRAMGMPEPEARAEITPTLQSDLPTKAPRPKDVSLNATLAQTHLTTPLQSLKQGLTTALGE
ncbi:dTDP-4-dehydrorhamnose reductase [Planctomycetes bacterium Poly30]|uniref:dTDP-4-dehydrorhamnose reductase n=1 Tax=Saltatorellus ferox TaxID=2528018 RepID=A0A518ER55_9BACT|nr:dTDP-4-dehydrorhamnose reductase [Planctomycetes bacterium Poly30]